MGNLCSQSTETKFNVDPSQPTAYELWVARKAEADAEKAAAAAYAASPEGIAEAAAKEAAKEAAAQAEAAAKAAAIAAAREAEKQAYDNAIADGVTVLKTEENPKSQAEIAFIKKRKAWINSFKHIQVSGTISNFKTDIIIKATKHGVSREAKFQLEEPLPHDVLEYKPIITTDRGVEWEAYWNVRTGEPQGFIIRTDPRDKIRKYEGYRGSSKLFEGLGRCTMNNGDIYEGTQRISRDGLGVYQESGGAGYMGDFKNGAMHGQGIKWRKDGSIVHSGTFDIYTNLSFI